MIYLNNPKAGCSTVKASLWSAICGTPQAVAGNVHDIEASPFTNEPTPEDGIEDTVVFTFVRNPFARVISAYVNKIVQRRDHVWPRFARAHGLDPDAEIGFDTFVECIATIRPENHDPHWRAQSINTLAAYLQPNFIGALEHIDTELPALLARLFPSGDGAMRTRNRHGTDASTRIRDYLRSEATRARLLDIYGEDFERFGYAPDPDAPLAPARAAKFSDHRHPQLVALLRRIPARPA